LNVGVQKFGWKMDWRKFRKFLADEYGVSKAYMFIGYVPEFESLYEQLHDLGYAIVLKPTFDMSRPRPEVAAESTDSKTEPEEKKPVKGNIDAELVLWAMKDFNTYDKAIVVSGDGDFYCLVEYLDEQKKLLNLMAPNQHYSRLFHPYEQYIVQLSRLRKKLAYREHSKGRRSPRSFLPFKKRDNK
jgi:uncharacterized LabA/DUF88 family protein